MEEELMFTFAIREGCLAALGVMLIFFSCHLACSIVSFLNKIRIRNAATKRIPAFIPLVVEWRLREPLYHPHPLHRQIGDHSASILQSISL